MGKIYIFGNCNKSITVFDTKTKTTEAKRSAKVREERSHSTCSVFAGRIVLSGGLDRSLKVMGPNMFPSKTVEVYDPYVNQWSQMPDMLETRYYHASVSIKNKLFMIGGSTTQCEVFDSFSNKFANIKPVLPIYKYAGLPTQYVTLGSKIKMFDRFSLDAVVFDIEKEDWSEEKGLDLRYAPYRLLFC